MTKFEEFNLQKELLSDLERMNFQDATEIQAISIGPAMDGSDLIVRSKTGSGKTGSYLIPIINGIREKNGPVALIITPTRELALQVKSVALEMGRSSHIKTAVIYGGSSIARQIDGLRRGPHIVVGTPGRILDLMNRGALDLHALRTLVLDEADMMLDMGFIDDIEEIISGIGHRTQMLLYSATIPKRVLDMSRRYMHDPEYIRTGSDSTITVPKIAHYFAQSKRSLKVATLMAYLDQYKPKKSIIFTETKRGAASLHRIMRENGHRATVIHGDLTQAMRERAMEEFRKRSSILVATNVAARGLDIDGISSIINFDIPSEPAIYAHRVGRSARMGKDGEAFTILERGNAAHIYEIEKKLGISMKEIELDTLPYDREYRHSESDRPDAPFHGNRGNFNGSRPFNRRNLNYYGNGRHH
jgi:ATP-dependent RNA helicase DeaD